MSQESRAHCLQLAHLRDSMLYSSARLTRHDDNTVLTVEAGASLHVGRFDIAPIDNDVKSSSVSRKQLQLQLSATTGLTLSMVGAAVSCVQRRGGNAIEPLVKCQATNVEDGDVLYLHSTGDPKRYAFPFTVSLLPVPAAPAVAVAPPAPAAPLPPAAPPAPAAPPTPAAPSAPAAPMAPSTKAPSPKAPAANVAEPSAAAGQKRPRSDAASSAAPVPSSSVITPAAPAAAADGRFRALSVKWRGIGEAERLAALTLVIDGDGRLEARVCDGVELRGTAVPMVCAPWALHGLPPAAELRADLRLHPVYDLEKWQLTLRGPTTAPPAHGATAGVEAVLSIDLDKLREAERSHTRTTGDANRAAGGIGGAMLRAMLARAASLRESNAAHAGENDALAAKLAQREGELTAAAEALRLRQVAELADVVPLMVAKQRKLAELEKEAMHKGITVRSSDGEASSTYGSGTTQDES